MSSHGGLYDAPHLAKRAANFAALTRTVVFGPLPKTATGKIQKFDLRERARGLAE